MLDRVDISDGKLLCLLQRSHNFVSSDLLALYSHWLFSLTNSLPELHSSCSTSGSLSSKSPLTQLGYGQDVFLLFRSAYYFRDRLLLSSSMSTSSASVVRRGIKQRYRSGKGKVVGMDNVGTDNVGTGLKIRRVTLSDLLFLELPFYKSFIAGCLSSADYSGRGISFDNGDIGFSGGSGNSTSTRHRYLSSLKSFFSHLSLLSRSPDLIKVIFEHKVYKSYEASFASLGSGSGSGLEDLGDILLERVFTRESVIRLESFTESLYSLSLSRNKRGLPRPLSYDDMQRLLDYFAKGLVISLRSCDKGLSSSGSLGSFPLSHTLAQRWCLVLVIWGTGLRIQEVLGLSWLDLFTSSSASLFQERLSGLLSSFALSSFDLSSFDLSSFDLSSADLCVGSGGGFISDKLFDIGGDLFGDNLFRDDFLIRGKGGRYRRVFILASLKRSFSLLLRFRLLSSSYFDLSEPVFVSPRYVLGLSGLTQVDYLKFGYSGGLKSGVTLRSPCSFTARYVQKWLGKARDDLGLPFNFTPHSLRHGFASDLYKGGLDPRSLQILLGHSSLSSTQIYTKVGISEIRDKLSQFHPLKGI